MSWSEPRPRAWCRWRRRARRRRLCHLCVLDGGDGVRHTRSAVTIATPGTPVRQATASAANTVLTSCRTSTTRCPALCSPPRSERCALDRGEDERHAVALQDLRDASPPCSVMTLLGRVLVAVGGLDRWDLVEVQSKEPSSSCFQPCTCDVVVRPELAESSVHEGRVFRTTCRQLRRGVRVVRPLLLQRVGRTMVATITASSWRCRRFEQHHLRFSSTLAGGPSGGIRASLREGGRPRNLSRPSNFP